MADAIPSRPPTSTIKHYTSNPITFLTASFLLYKTLLLLITLLCPGPGYDTSTTLLPGSLYQPPPSRDGHGLAPTGLGQPASQLVRWDALYFLDIARRGYAFEQQWAFSYAHGRLMAGVARVLGFGGGQEGIDGEGVTIERLAWAGVILSHVAHYASTIVLYHLTKAVFTPLKSDTKPPETQPPTHLPTITALLHILTPAGAFFSAPNPEATFSLLNFGGFYAYITALRCEGKSRPQLLSRDAAFLLAGCLFGAATLLRSNGLLSGSLFAYDAILEADKQLRKRRLVPSRRLLALVLGGSVIFVAFSLPQAIAYTQFCGDEGTARPWCGAVVPTIYGFVQKHYWDVGFLRYWKLSNLPLFLLAAPMLATLIASTTIVFNRSTSAPKNDTPREQQQQQQQQHHSPPSSQTITSTYLLRLSIPQLILAVSALAIYHVQIINRIASGYPVWYWYIALLILSPSPASVADVPARKREKVARALVTAMVMYGLIQGVLYANSLPPA